MVVGVSRRMRGREDGHGKDRKSMGERGRETENDRWEGIMKEDKELRPEEEREPGLVYWAVSTGEVAGLVHLSCLVNISQLLNKQ